MNILLKIGLILLSVSTALAQIDGSKGSASFSIESGRSFAASKGTTAEGKRLEPKKHMLAASVVSDLAEAMSIIGKNHADGAKIKPSVITSTSIDEMLRTLDPHSRYYDEKEFADLSGGHRSEYSGTGMYISDYQVAGQKSVYVIAVGPGTSAETAGLKFGDKFVSIEGRDVAGLNAAEIRDLVRGPNGTELLVTVEKADGTKKKNILLKRGRISGSSVSDSFVGTNGFGYVGLRDGFSFSTAAEFGLAIAELKESGMRSLVIDLRGNGGGIFEQAVEIAEMFLSNGTHIVSQEGRTPADQQSWVSENKRPETMPVVVLVDGSTASAAEILAGALQDNDRALIVGERTFGKGLVQNVIELPNGSGLTLTTAKYFTPSGRSIQRDYSDESRYDYFLRTNRGELIASAEKAFRTTTGRVVYGGNGINPDRLLAATAGPDQYATFAAVENLAFELVREEMSSITQPQIVELRRKILFGEAFVSDALLAEAIKRGNCDFNNVSKVEVHSTLRSDLSYNLALAVFDLKTADQVKIKTEIEKMEIGTRVREAAELYARSGQETKKARRVTSRAGLNGRNRRN